MKKILSYLLTGTLILSLAACGQTEGSNTTTDVGNESVISELSEGENANTAEGENANTAEGEVSGLQEAPALKEQVDAGSLPEVAKRMPISSDIMVDSDIMEIGSYGGSMTMQADDNGRWGWGPWAEQGMFRFKQDGSGEVEANVCKEFSSNEDASVWTIKLREGMRWSDGEPFTADDVIFYYDHMSTPSLNEDRTAVDPEEGGYYSLYTSKAYQCYQVDKDGETYWAEFEKVNDYEFTITFAAPKPAFPSEVAVDNKWMFLPKHFYIDFVSRKDGVTDDETFPAISEEEALANGNEVFGKQWDSYSTMGRDIGYYHWDYALVPQVRSFIAVKDNWDVIGETYELVRNPYFWKTDSQGNQLPYLDSLKFKIINEQDQITLQAVAGEFDLYGPNTDYSTVATALQDSHYLSLWGSADWSTDETIQLNQTVKDEDKRALFQDPRFRQALSICVDRNLLNETLRNGMSEPTQASVANDLIGHSDSWSAKWTEFDIDAANKLMDEITEPWDQKEGTYRKMKGTDKTVEIILSIKEPSVSGDFVSLISSAYGKIGVQLSSKVDADYRTTMLSNDVEASVEITSVSTPALRPDSIIPIRNVAVWHSAYGKWYEDGKTTANGGIEPAGDILELLDAYEAIKSASGSNRADTVQENVQKIYDLHEKNIWIIGYLSALPKRQLINNDIKNVPEGFLMVDEFRFINLGRPEQFWRESKD